MAECREWMEQISASLDGELSPEEEQALEEHLAECRDCRTAMALLQSMAKVMREDTVQPPEKLAEGTRYLFEQEKKDRGFRWKRWRFTAIAAVICLALFGVIKLAPWSAGSGGASAPMTAAGVWAESDVKVSAPAAPASALNEMKLQAGGAAAAPQAPEEPAPGPETEVCVDNTAEAAEAEPTEQMSGLRSAAPAADAGKTDTADGLPGASAQDLWTNGAIYSAESLPGYAIYSQLDGAESYYSVCFVYGEVPETIRANRECTPLSAPEGQERWLVPHSVCVNEGLLEQFSEVYYGDLLSQQGLVIGILDMEEDQWQP